MAKLKRQVLQKKHVGLLKKRVIGKSKDVQKIKNGVVKNDKRQTMKNQRKAVKTPPNNDEKEEEHKNEMFEVAPMDDKGSLSHIIPDIDDLPENEGEANAKDDMRTMVKNQNKKQKQKQSGGFQSMGLTYNTYKGVIRKGYKIPTPIQRKTIPLIMDGKDVVGMARTGSGKTGAFLIPMLEKLNVHSSGGVRAVILSPTRELALQTSKFTHELGKFSDLKATLIVGGDSIENQFAALHKNPDIIIATPGRFLHLLVEMDMKKLDEVEYVVFDEADRLFEMGFAEQLKEIIQRLPESRQTVLFSATLPKVLVDFASAGLNEPTLIRLDVDVKISDKLRTSYFLLRDEDKTSCLLHMLRNTIKPEELTLIFVATRHHVEYLQELLMSAGILCSYIYSSLDQTARKMHLDNFRSKKYKILIVTDVAARGIDVPMLDNVINFDFPPRPKIFIHRVGRVARAGRSGTAYSFVLKDELSFFIDMHLFLGRPIKYAFEGMEIEEDGVIGSVPQGVIVSESDYIKNKTDSNYNLVAAHKVMKNGYKGYLRTRESASNESNKRAKEIDTASINSHPCFKNANSENNEQLSKLLFDLHKFKPSLTVFETLTTKKSNNAVSIMQSKRKKHTIVIEREKLRQEEKPLVTPAPRKEVSIVCDDNYIAESFNLPSKGFRDENYIPHQARDGHKEKGFSLTSFEKEAKKLSVDLIADETNQMRSDKAGKKWDRKRKKFVGVENPNAKKFKTESGNYIPKSYKSDKYKEWTKNNLRYTQKKSVENDNDNDPQSQQMNRFKKRVNNASGNKKVAKGTLKNKEQIIKKRMKDDLQEKLQRKKSGKKSGGNKPDGNKPGGNKKTGGNKPRSIKSGSNKRFRPSSGKR